MTGSYRRKGFWKKKKQVNTREKNVKKKMKKRILLKYTDLERRFYGTKQKDRS